MRTTRIQGIDKDWSVITLGCWQIAPSGGWGDLCSAQDAEATVKAALHAGITAFDTAEGYGDGESERRLGSALGGKKNDVVIISKIWPDAELTADSYRQRLEGTLRALGRDHVDLYLVHWPGNYFNSPEKSADLCELMIRLQESGKTCAIGLSNFQAGDLALLGDDVSRFSVNQIPYSLLEREYEGASLEACRKSDIGYMAYSPTARGLLAGKLDKKDMKPPCRKNFEVYQEPLFAQSKKVYAEVVSVAQEIGAEPINAALAWVLAQDNLFTAIAGSRKPHQVPQFAQAGDILLPPDCLSRLNAASDSFHKVKAGI